MYFRKFLYTQRGIEILMKSFLSHSAENHLEQKKVVPKIFVKAKGVLSILVGRFSHGAEKRIRRGALLSPCNILVDFQ